MATDINLLVQKQKGFFSKERLLLLAKATAVISVILVLSLSILFFLLSRDPSIVAIKADEAKTIAQLTLLQSKTAKYLVVIDRVNKIKLVQKSRTEFGDTMQALVSHVVNGATLTNFVLDQHTVSLSVSATDLSLLGKTVDNFMTLVAEKKVLKELTIQGLVSDEKGGKYIMNITGTLL